MPEIYTVKDPWGYWWSSVVSPEEGYVCHGVADEKTMELRTLDYIIEGYGILDDGIPQEVIEDDEVIMAWADDVIVRRVAAQKPEKKSEPVERGEDPSVFDSEVALENLLRAIEDELYEQEGVRFPLGEKAIREFAEKVWDAAEEATATDMAKCCGCSGSDEELNPFKEQK